MLDRNAKPVRLWGFIVGVEVEDGGHTLPTRIPELLSDAVNFCEGIGKIHIETLGVIEEINEPE